MLPASFCFKNSYCLCFWFISARGDCPDACYLSLGRYEETAHPDDWQVLRWDLDQLRGTEDGTNITLPASRWKAYCILQCHTVTINFTVQPVNAGFHSGAEWEVTGGGGRKWRAEEQLHHRDCEGSGIYMEDSAIWSPPCHFTSPTAALTREYNAQNPSSSRIHCYSPFTV